MSKLETEFNNAMNNSTYTQNFIDFSKEIAENSPYVKEFAFIFANYTTKLIIKNIKDGKLENAKDVLISYINNLLPLSGPSGKTSDVSSNGLVLGIRTKDEVLNQMIFEKLLGPDLQIENLENEILLYNLSSYYAIHNEKELLLKTVKQALNKGKKSNQFLTDKDFKFYWDDEDFIKVVNDSNEIKK